MIQESAETFTETAELTALGKTATSEFALAKNIADAIQPKAKEFDALKADAKVKMAARRDEHLARAKKALSAARDLMQDKSLGSFVAWIKSGAVIGLSGKVIAQSQVYRLLDGVNTGNTPKIRKSSPTTANGGTSTRSSRTTSSHTQAPGRSTPDVSDLEDLKSAVRALSPPDFTAFKAWFREFCGA